MIMNRKIVVFLIIILVVAAGCSMVCVTLDIGKNGDQKADTAQKQINSLLNSKEYEDASLEERKEKAEKLLKLLQKEHCIRFLHYNEEGLAFSFEFANGTLGALVLKDFSAQPGELPMN